LERLTDLRLGPLDDRTFSWGDQTIDHCVTRPTTLDPVPFTSTLPRVRERVEALERS
jgi:hypothetical protein